MSGGNGYGVFDTERRGQFRREVPPLSAAWHERARGVIARYPEGEERSALLSLLYLAQSEHGFVSGAAMETIAGLLGLTRAEVQAVATFYTMFKREPQGRWLVSVCTQPSCALAGGVEIKERLEAELGIACGATTPDGSVSLEEVECLCACDGAPVFSVNYDNYEGMSAADAVALVAGLRDGGAPPPGARGVAPVDFAAINDEMAGEPGERA